MADTEGDAGDHHRLLHARPAQSFEQEAPEDHFLQKADAQHTDNVQRGFRRRVIHPDAPPEIGGRQQHQRDEKQILLRASLKRAKAVFLLQAVSANPQVHGKHQSGADRRGDDFGSADRLRNAVSSAHQNDVNADPYQCKAQFALFIYFPHFQSPFPRIRHPKILFSGTMPIGLLPASFRCLPAGWHSRERKRTA